MHQVIYNILVTKDLGNKVLNYIDPWGENLASISWVIQDDYNYTIKSTPGHAVLGRHILLNLDFIVY